MAVRHNNHGTTDAICLACDQDEQEWIATHCLVTVQYAGEGPQPCGLETPCPTHRDQAEEDERGELHRTRFDASAPRVGEYRDPRPHWSVRNPVERASIMLGEARDV